MPVVLVTRTVTVTPSRSVIVVTSTVATADVPTSTATSGASEDAGPGATLGASGSNAQSVTAGSTAAGGGTGSASAGNSAPTIDGSSSTRSFPVAAVVGGAVGGLALLALIVVLACLMISRSKARKTANPFVNAEREKHPTIIAGLPPNPSSRCPRPISGSFNTSITMADSASATPLLCAPSSQDNRTSGALMPGTASSERIGPSSAPLAPSLMYMPPSFLSHYSGQFSFPHTDHNSA